MSSVRLYTEIIMHIQNQKSKSNKKLFRIQTRPLLVIGKNAGLRYVGCGITLQILELH